MIYYSVIYMKDGRIHLNPSSSKEEAESVIAKVKESIWKDQIEYTKVIKRDPESPWFKSLEGHWI